MDFIVEVPQTMAKAKIVPSGSIKVSEINVVMIDGNLVFFFTFSG